MQTHTHTQSQMRNFKYALVSMIAHPQNGDTFDTP